MFTLIKYGIIIGAIAAAQYTGFLPFVVAGLVIWHMVPLVQKIGAVAAAKASFLPACVAVLGVAAMNTARLDFMMSAGLAFACAVGYNVLRPNARRF